MVLDIQPPFLMHPPPLALWLAMSNTLSTSTTTGTLQPDLISHLLSHAPGPTSFATFRHSNEILRGWNRSKGMRVFPFDVGHRRENFNMICLQPLALVKMESISIWFLYRRVFVSSLCVSLIRSRRSSRRWNRAPPHTVATVTFASFMLVHPPAACNDCNN